MERNILFQKIIMFFLLIFLINLNILSEERIQRIEDDGSLKRNEIQLKSKNTEFNINILKSIPAPGLGDSRGLTWDGVNLWFSEDDSKLLFKIDTSSGAVLDSFPTPGLSYTEGLAWDGQAIWHAEYNGRMYKIDPASGVFLDTLELPTAKPTGITWDGNYFWAANYQLDSLYQFSPIDGSLINRFASPGTYPWGLTKAGNLWNCNLNGENIYEIDPSNGNVISSYLVPANSMYNGLTFDGKYLWVVDNNDDLIKQLDITVSVSIHDKPSNKIVSGIELKQNYPNPFNPVTTIKYELNIPTYVTIEVFNLLGKNVENLIKKHMPAGIHEVIFTAQDIPSGVYLYKIEAGIYRDVKKMILLR